MEWIPIRTFKKILGLKSRIKAIYGGSSAGKTVSILPYLYQKAVDNPGEVITVVSDTLANLKKGAVRDFKNILLSTESWNPEGWSKTDSIYTLRNGSIIEFVGCDDETKLRGPRRNRCYINEANRVSFDVFQQLDRRTDKEMILDWNPSGAFWYNEHIKDHVDHDVLVVNYTDNEALSEQQMDYFRELKRQSTRSAYMLNEWKVYGLGEWGALAGACIKDYGWCHKGSDGSFYSVEEDSEGNPAGSTLEGYKLCGIGLDFGNNDPNAGVALYKHSEKKSFIAEEILYKPGISIPYMHRLLSKYDTTIYADYSWPQTIMELNRLFNTNKVLKCKKGPDSIKNGIDLINEVELFVVRGSNNLAKEFQMYRYKEDKDGNLVDGKFEGPDHLVDALRYVLTRNIKKRKLKLSL